MHYKARNFPNTLSEREQQTWQNYRHPQLLEEDNSSTLTLAKFRARIQELQKDNAVLVDKSPHDKSATLDELLSYSANISFLELSVET